MSAVFPHHPIIELPPPAARNAIAAKYNSLGGANGALGPTNGLHLDQHVPGTNGWSAVFQNGEIYWFPESGAHAIFGNLYNKWKSAGSGKSPVGYPISDMTTSPLVAGFQTFQHGAISMQAGDGTNFGGLPVMIYTDIYSKWISLGGLQAGIGVPTIDESPTIGGALFSTFSNGAAIYWTAANGAHVVMGAIYQKYKEVGAETGFLGLPLTDELPSGSGRYNDFTGGFIYWSSVTGIAHAVQGGLPTSIDFPPQQYSFPSGIAAGGSSHIAIFSNGQAQFEGQFHDSGALAYDISVAVVLADADRRGYSFTTVGHIAGTFESGSRDYVWSTSANNGLVAENWRAIVASHTLFPQASESLDLGALLTNVANVAGIIGAAAGVVQAASGAGAAAGAAA